MTAALEFAVVRVVEDVARLKLDFAAPVFDVVDFVFLLLPVHSSESESSTRLRFLALFGSVFCFPLVVVGFLGKSSMSTSSLALTLGTDLVPSLAGLSPFPSLLKVIRFILCTNASMFLYTLELKRISWKSLLTLLRIWSTASDSCRMESWSR